MNKSDVFDIIFDSINDIDLARLEYAWKDCSKEGEVIEPGARYILAKIDNKKYQIKIVIEEV